MGTLDQALVDFRKDTERTEHLLQLIKAFREFGASKVPSAVSDQTVSWPEASSLVEVSQLRRTDLPILSGSLLLYLAGRFEYFVREVIQCVADEIAANSPTYQALPEALRKELRSRTLEIATNPHRYGFDEIEADGLLGSLVGNFSGSSLSINSTVLSITEFNMKDRVVSDLTKRVGMVEFWKEIGKQAQLKVYLETVTDGETTAKSQNMLNSIMDERNQIAHPTGATKFPDPDQVLKSAAFLTALANVTTDIVRVHLVKFRPQARAAVDAAE